MRHLFSFSHPSQLSGTDEASVTLLFKGEGHTLGNALRYMLIRHPDVDFAAYTVPHPLVDEMRVRVKTTGRPALEVTRQAVQNLLDVCDHMNDTFDRAFE